MDSSTSMDDSFALPAPMSYQSDVSSDEEVENDNDFCEELSDDERSAIYKDWISELEQEDAKMLTMLLYDNCRSRFGLLKTFAAKEVGLCLGIGEKTVRRLRKNFIADSDKFDVDGRGKQPGGKVIDDKECRELALEWVRADAYVKGELNMTTSTFCSRLNNTLLPNFAGDHPNMPSSVSKCTAVRWLYCLGFEKVDSKKGVYIDGHE